MEQNLHEVEQQTEASVVIWCRRLSSGLLWWLLPVWVVVVQPVPLNQNSKSVLNVMTVRRSSYKHVWTRDDGNTSNQRKTLGNFLPLPHERLSAVTCRHDFFQTYFFMHAVPESWYYEGLSLIQRKHPGSGSVQYICSISLPVDD